MDSSSPLAIADPAQIAAASAAQGGITIRPLESLANFQACVAVQNAVWGPSFGEAVPVSLLQVATYLGGLAIGAFNDEGALLGFVFGLTGVQAGRAVHWSHLLGVVAAARNLGLGRLLKEHQRVELARAGIDEMRWTFDPLIAKNAHLNLNLLGARVVRYAPDMYGTTSSPMHHGLATDRLVVACATTRAFAPDTHFPAPAGVMDEPLLTLEPQAGDIVVDRDGGGTAESRIRLEIPTDFQQLMAQFPARAAAWHAAVRTHFLWSIDRGYEVVGLRRDPIASRSFYVLALKQDTA